MTQKIEIKQKIDGEFYPLTPQVSQKLRKANLTAAEWRFWAYLVEIDPWGDRYKDITPMVVMAECEMSKPTYYRAKAKFQELGLFDFQEEKVSFRNLTGVSKMRQPSQKSNSSLKNETVVSEMRLDSQEREIESLEPLTVKVSSSSKTSKTKKDLNKTLSEREHERENFSFFNSLSLWEKVAIRKLGELIAAELPQYPALMDKWLMKNAEHIHRDSRYYGWLDKVLTDNGVKPDPNLDQNSQNSTAREIDW